MMKKINFCVLAVLLCSGLVLTACKGGHKGTSANADPEEEIAGNDETRLQTIALELGFDNPDDVIYTEGGFDIIDAEEEEGPQINYYHHVRAYAELDELDRAIGWLVFSYDVGSRELKVYDFDGAKLKPGTHMIVDDWKQTRADEDYAEVFLSPDVVEFIAPVGDSPDYPVATYTYDPSCDGLFEPDDLFEE